MQDVRTIPAGAVFAMLVATSRGGSSREWFAEIATALERASHDDPLFAHPLGPAATAALLVALAGYRTDIRRQGFGQGHGLFAIVVGDGEDDRGILGTSHGSAYVAVDQIRRSFERGACLPMQERLAHFFASNDPRPSEVSLEHRFASAAVMAKAAALLRTHVPEAVQFAGRGKLPMLEESAA